MNIRDQNISCEIRRLHNVNDINSVKTGPSPVTPAVDIYSFGMAALEMAALEIPGNGDSGNVVTQEQVGCVVITFFASYSDRQVKT